jgi:hypothetical protein
MAKARAKNFIKPQEKRKIEYPSEFGSHASMINEEATKALKDPNKVVLEDGWGDYVTDRNRLGNGLADPNRYSGRDQSVKSTGL